MTFVSKVQSRLGVFRLVFTSNRRHKLFAKFQIYNSINNAIFMYPVRLNGLKCSMDALQGLELSQRRYSIHHAMHAKHDMILELRRALS